MRLPLAVCLILTGCMGRIGEDTGGPAALPAANTTMTSAPGGDAPGAIPEAPPAGAPAPKGEPPPKETPPPPPSEPAPEPTPPLPPKPAPATQIARLGATFDIATVGSNKRHADVAFDPIHAVYLVVHGSAPIGGAFIDSDGNAAGAPFAISQTPSWAQFPSVTWFPAAGAFLVVWHGSDPGTNTPTPRARLVAFDKGAVSFKTPELKVSPAMSYQEVALAVACASPAAECLVVWTTGAVLTAQRIGVSGALLGGAIALAPGSDWNGDCAASIAPGGSTYVVTHTHADGSGASLWRRLVQVGTGAPAGAPLELGHAAGTWAALSEWDSVNARYFTGWWEGSAKSRLLGADGMPLGASASLVPGYGNYDGLAISFNASAGVYAVALHGSSEEDFAALIHADGSSAAPILATASPAGTHGNFNPRLAAHATRREWLMVSVRNYATVVGQRLVAR